MGGYGGFIWPSYAITFIAYLAVSGGWQRAKTAAQHLQRPITAITIQRQTKINLLCVVSHHDVCNQGRRVFIGQDAMPAGPLPRLIY